MWLNLKAVVDVLWHCGVSSCNSVVRQDFDCGLASSLGVTDLEAESSILPFKCPGLRMWVKWSRLTPTLKAVIACWLVNRVGLIRNCSKPRV